MSADNWDECPRCKLLAEQDRQKRQARADKGYGKVSQEEYARLVAKAAEPVELKATLREDYGLGLTDDGFYVSYRCCCGTCGFEFTHKQEVPIDFGKKPRPED